MHYNNDFSFSVIFFTFSSLLAVLESWTDCDNKSILSRIISAFNVWHCKYDSKINEQPKKENQKYIPHIETTANEQYFNLKWIMLCSWLFSLPKTTFNSQCSVVTGDQCHFIRIYEMWYDQQETNDFHLDTIIFSFQFSKWNI